MPENSNQNFTELEVWRKMRDLKNEVFQLIKKFPPEEKFSLSDQMLRSSRSVNSNISEGHGRFTYKDQLHFCVQARGSLSETLNHLIDAFDCKYITNDELVAYKLKIDEVVKLLNGYISYLKKQIQ